MTTAREEILSSIRSGLAAAREEPGFQEPAPVAGNRVGIPVLPDSASAADTFSQSLEAVGGIVHRCPRGEGEATLERILQDLGAEKVARSDSLSKLGELLEAEHAPWRHASADQCSQSGVTWRVHLHHHAFPTAGVEGLVEDHDAASF
mgnify:CR=1 FL=1